MFDAISFKIIKMIIKKCNSILIFSSARDDFIERSLFADPKSKYPEY